MDWKLAPVIVPVPDVNRAKSFHYEPDGRQAPGPDPERLTYKSYVAFSDPDGNGWLVQEARPEGLELS